MKLLKTFSRALDFPELEFSAPISSYYRFGWYIPLCYRWHISFRYARHISFCCRWHIDSVAIKEYKGILKEYRDDMVKYAPDKDISAATDAIDSQAFMKVDPPLFEGDRIL